MAQLLREVKVVLDRVKIYSCDQCPLGFLDQTDWCLHQTKFSHIKEKEENLSNNNNKYIKVHQCPDCNKKFVHESTLKAHSFVHEPIPYVCHCGVAYYKSCDLKDHKKLVHSDEMSIESIEEAIEPVKTKTSKPKMKSVQIKKLKNKKIRGRNSKPGSQKIKHNFDKKLNDNLVYSCPICNKTFKNKGNVVKHKVTHSEVKPYGCELCDARFTQKGSLNIHMKRHAGIKDEKCQYCGKEFLGRHARINHEYTHTKVKPYECKHCGKAFADRSATIRHERIHTRDMKYKCEYCSKGFTDASGVIRHRLMHKGKKDFACRICDKTFYTTTDLRIHLLSHTAVKDYQCDYCKNYFTKKCNLINHIRTIHYGQKLYRCTECFKNFSGTTNMIKHKCPNSVNKNLIKCELCGLRTRDISKHTKSFHTKNHFYLCDNCPNQYTWKWDLIRHMLKQHIKIKCKKCLSYFSSNSDLKRHNRIGCFKCKKCDKNLESEQTYKSHIKKHAKKEEFAKYSCSKCDCAFSLPASLTNHYRLKHLTDPAYYECDHCKKVFNTKLLLVSHVKDSHMNALYCDVCKKKFYSETEFRQHKRIVCQSPGNWFCEICDKTFSRRKGLSSHLLFHSSTASYECDYCGKKFKLKNLLAIHIRRKHIKETRKVPKKQPKSLVFVF